MGAFFSKRKKKKKEPAAAPKEEVATGPRELSISKVLADKDATATFLSFAQGEFSAENLEFWLEVNAFKARWDKMSDAAARDADCKQMIATFLTNGAERQVCIGDHRVAQIPSENTKTMFDVAQSVALETISLDIFPRFCDSPKGLELAKRVALTEPLKAGAAARL